LVLPLTARVNAQHHLEIGGCDVVALAREYGTPLYVFDDEHLRVRAREIRNVFHARWQNSLILYATKAYFSPYLARLYKEASLGIDVTSEGELEIARRADFPCDQIYLHGNNKTPTEIRAALAMGVQYVVIDNLDEIELLSRIANELGATPRVLLRLAPAIDPHTHHFLATGVAESKFGMSIANGDALKAAQLVTRHSPRLTLVGLHVHIGSQIFEPDPYRDAVSVVLDSARELHKAVGFELQQLNLGGGWGVAYTEEQQTLSADVIADTVASTLASRLSPLVSRLIFEPGRALVAQAAVALYTVGTVKPINNARTYVSVDGGIGDNIRPALYGAKYTARVANRMDDAPAQRVAIAGRYCEQGDVLIEEFELPRVVVGDLVAVPCAGAYQIPMASNSNLIPRPAVVVARDGNARVIRRRETIQDMLRWEIDE
jgi:diaminopimelate decarboxylase